MKKKFPSYFIGVCCCCFFLVFSYWLCALWFYLTSNVVKLMLLEYFNILCVTMMVFCVCVNETLPFSARRKAVCDELWFIM